MKTKIEGWMQDLYTPKMLGIQAFWVLVFVVAINIIGAVLIAIPLVLAVVSGVYLIKLKVNKWKTTKTKH